MTELNQQQKEAFKKLLNVLQYRVKEYLTNQGRNIELITIREINTEPYYEINYKKEFYITVKFHTYSNGYEEFVLKLHDELCEEKIISQETNNYFIKKEFKISSFIMDCLNEMFKIKKGDIEGYFSINDDGSPLSEFKKNFIV